MGPIILMAIVGVAGVAVVEDRKGGGTKCSNEYMARGSVDAVLVVTTESGNFLLLSCSWMVE